MKKRINVTAGHRTAAKIIGSLGVVGTAAAIAGMGTFGTFTDSTTPVDATVETGVLSIELDPAVNYATVPVVTGGLLPGDTLATPFDLRNAGTVDWESVTIKSWAAVSSLLDTDPVNGLQVTLQSCSQAWDVAGPGAYSCAGGVNDYYSGPIVTEQPLLKAASLTAGKTDHLLATIEFPEDAGNTMKNLTSQLAFTFTAVQRDGAPR